MVLFSIQGTFAANQQQRALIQHYKDQQQKNAALMNLVVIRSRLASLSLVLRGKIALLTSWLDWEQISTANRGLLVRQADRLRIRIHSRINISFLS